MLLSSRRLTPLIWVDLLELLLDYLEDSLRLLVREAPDCRVHRRLPAPQLFRVRKHERLRRRNPDGFVQGLDRDPNRARLQRRVLIELQIALGCDATR